ncbi:MAG: hypothetical protein GX025_01630 [Clostridiales bacterium]|nr:hypothetical protein [Clostridiales bacterium]
MTKDVIEGLFLTHHTRSDGITYDLRTNSPVNIFDLKSAYDVAAMDEVIPLKNHWQLIVESVGDTEVSDRIKEILELDLHDSYTDDRDDELSDLQSYLRVLRNNDDDAAEKDIVQRTMQAVDASRRVHSLNTALDELEAYMDELGSPEAPPADEDGNQESAQQSDTSLISAVSESIANVEDSIIDYEGNMLSEGTTVYQFFRYKYETDLISHAKAGSHSDCDADVANLLYLENILNDIISNRPAEMALLSPAILEEATNRYTSALSAGESAEYKAQKANKSAQVLLDSIASTNTSIINTARNELEFMISAYCTRAGAAAAKTYIDQRIKLCQSFYLMPPSDAFHEGAVSTVDSHMDFLTEKLRCLTLALGGNELDKLIAEKGDLQTQLRSALDKNDLAGAADIEKEIADIDKKITELENAASAELFELMAKVSDLEKQIAEAQKAENTSLFNKLSEKLAAAKAELNLAQSSLSDGTLAQQVATLKKDALSILSKTPPSNAEMSRLSTDITALCELLPLDTQLVFPALTEIYNAMVTKAALENTDAYEADKTKIEEAILNNKDSYDTAMRSDKSADDLRKIADDFISGETGGGEPLFGQLDSLALTDGSNRQALLDKYGEDVFVLALSSYYDETGSDAALNLMVSIAQQQRNLGSLSIYSRINSGSGRFIPLSAIGVHTGMRYVEKSAASFATLAKGSSYYGFRVYSDSVIKGKTAPETDYMPQAAAYYGGIHIIESYSYETFGVDCVYLSGCDLAVARSETVKALAEELTGLFLA